MCYPIIAVQLAFKQPISVEPKSFDEVEGAAFVVNLCPSTSITDFATIPAALPRSQLAGVGV